MNDTVVGGQKRKRWSNITKEWLEMTIPERLNAIAKRSCWNRLSVFFWGGGGVIFIFFFCPYVHQ